VLLYFSGALTLLVVGGIAASTLSFAHLFYLFLSLLLIIISLGAFRVLLETFFSNDLLKHILTLFNHVVFKTELLDFSAHSIQRYYFGLQDVLQEDDHKSHHPLLVYLVL
jgi:hypothetical protein